MDLSKGPSEQTNIFESFLGPKTKEEEKTLPYDKKPNMWNMPEDYMNDDEIDEIK
jgi:hypothetical protein